MHADFNYEGLLPSNNSQLPQVTLTYQVTTTNCCLVGYCLHLLVIALTNHFIVTARAHGLNDSEPVLVQAT